MDKRNFLKNTGTIALGSYFVVEDIFINLEKKYQNWSPSDIATEEKFWDEVRKGYRLKSDYINLENGYYCFMPEATLENFITHIRSVNLHGSYYMRTTQTQNKEKAANMLADMMGCGHDELIITRNTTESLDTIINGYDWKEGDEAVMADQDYGYRLGADRKAALTMRSYLFIASRRPANAATS